MKNENKINTTIAAATSSVIVVAPTISTIDIDKYYHCTTTTSYSSDINTAPMSDKSEGDASPQLTLAILLPQTKIRTAATTIPTRLSTSAAATAITSTTTPPTNDDTKDNASRTILNTSMMRGARTQLAPILIHKTITKRRYPAAAAIIDDIRRQPIADVAIATTKSTRTHRLVGTKLCTQCNQERTADQFTITQWRAKDSNTCRDCINSKVKRLLWPQMPPIEEQTPSLNLWTNADNIVLQCDKCLCAKARSEFTLQSLYDFKRKNNLKLVCLLCMKKRCQELVDNLARFTEARARKLALTSGSNTVTATTTTTSTTMTRSYSRCTQ